MVCYVPFRYVWFGMVCICNVRMSARSHTCAQAHTHVCIRVPGPARVCSLDVPVAALAPRIRPKGAVSTLRRRVVVDATLNCLRRQSITLCARAYARWWYDASTPSSFFPLETIRRVRTARPFRHRGVHQTYPHPPPLASFFSFSVTFLSLTVSINAQGTSPHF